jgi:small subunit ribosomal protein S6
MMRYEVLMLTIPEITQDESKMIESQIEQAINNAKASLLSFERWGKYRLAYPVNNNDYGIYFLVRFELPDAQALLKELQTLYTVKLNDLVMRTMCARLDNHAPLAYQRPPSLEEAPAQREGGFFRERDRDHRDRDGMFRDEGNGRGSMNHNHEEAKA